MSVQYCTIMYQVKYSTVVHRKVRIINRPMLCLNNFKNVLINAAFNLFIRRLQKEIATLLDH